MTTKANAAVIPSSACALPVLKHDSAGPNIYDRSRKRMPAMPFEIDVVARVIWKPKPFVNTGLSTVHLGTVGGVGILSDGLLVAFHRAGVQPDWNQLARTPVIDKDAVVLFRSDTGEVVRSFGSKAGFKVPHGVFVDSFDNIWLTDVGLHQVFKFDREGKLLMTLGVEGGPLPGKESQQDSDNKDPTRFNKPADVSVDPDSGTVYIADGYGNSRALAFDSSGKFLRMFGGTFGSGPGEIDIAHNVAYAEGRLIVCDGSNSRFHVYDAETTELLQTWKHSSELLPPDPEDGAKYWTDPLMGRLSGHRTGFAWAVRWDAATRMLYTLEGSTALMRTLEGEVLGKWDVEPSHGLAVKTLQGKTQLFMGDLKPQYGQIFCFCGVSHVKRFRAEEDLQ